MEITRTHTSKLTTLRETRSDLERREFPVNTGMHEYRVSGSEWMSAPLLYKALGLDRYEA